MNKKTVNRGSLRAVARRILPPATVFVCGVAVLGYGTWGTPPPVPEMMFMALGFACGQWARARWDSPSNAARGAAEPRTLDGLVGRKVKP